MSGPIALSDEQETAIKQWAADDRLWTTQETVEFNLRTFARLILKLAEVERLRASTESARPKTQDEIDEGLARLRSISAEAIARLVRGEQL